MVKDKRLIGGYVDFEEEKLIKRAVSIYNMIRPIKLGSQIRCEWMDAHVGNDVEKDDLQDITTIITYGVLYQVGFNHIVIIMEHYGDKDVDIFHPDMGRKVTVVPTLNIVKIEVKQ